MVQGASEYLPGSGQGRVNMGTHVFAAEFIQEAAFHWSSAARYGVRSRADVAFCDGPLIKVLRAFKPVHPSPTTFRIRKMRTLGSCFFPFEHTLSLSVAPKKMRQTCDKS